MRTRKVVSAGPTSDRAGHAPSGQSHGLQAAHGQGARLVTTEKDWVRLDADSRMMVDALPVRLEFADPGALDTLLADVLEAAS